MPLGGPPLAGPTTLVKILQSGLERAPDATALVSLEASWSWRDLEQGARRLAAHYLDLGLSPGDRVASLLPNRGALLIHYLACFKAGLVATPLNYRYQAPEIDHALEVSGAELLVVHAERHADLARSAWAPRLRRGQVTYGDPAAPRRLEDMLAREAPPRHLPEVRPDAPAFIFFTSGSTGKPKGVTHSHESFGWVVASAAAGLQLTPGDVFLPATSASHVAASSLSMAGFAAGCCVALARAFDARELVPLLRQARPSLLCMLPAPLFGLVRDPAAERDDFASLRQCISGGDKVSAELEREFTRLSGQPIEEVYGMTETGTTTFSPPGARNRLGSMGCLAPGVTAAVRDERGGEVAAGATGRLWIRWPGNMTGYWGRPDATAETIVDGWLDTGDLVSADEQGYLWFRGRKKQIIIHDGSNICPQEVEESLLEHPAVAGVGVVGVHDLVHGENVRAYVALRPEAPPPSAAELIAFSRERVGYKAPDEILVLPSLPLNAVGKVDRVALKALAEPASQA